MFSYLSETIFIMPVCYHPTTVISVDDDEEFSKILSLSIDDRIPVICFNSPEDARTYTKSKHHHLPFTSRCYNKTQESIEFDPMAIRNEIYNSDRFKEIIINVTDYDMPKLSGVELVKTLEFHSDISQYSHIFLTGKISDEFKEKVNNLGLIENYIGKDEPNYVNKLLDMVEKHSKRIFQWYSYQPARQLSREQLENTYFLFDGSFVDIFNTYLKDNDICEFYLFDKQGSYIFLDKDANLSWLFMRNETGIKNSVELAEKYGAPKEIIDKLKSKNFILSLYEPEDFAKRDKIDWGKYLLPSTKFESDEKHLSAFPNLLPEKDGQKETPVYYYAFTNQFPEHGIKENKILSYQDFIKEQG